MGWGAQGPGQGLQAGRVAGRRQDGRMQDQECRIRSVQCRIQGLQYCIRQSGRIPASCCGSGTVIHGEAESVRAAVRQRTSSGLRAASSSCHRAHFKACQ